MSTEFRDGGGRTAAPLAGVQVGSREFRLAALNLLEDIAEARRRSEQAVRQQVRAEAEVEAIEERYRALFSRMDQGLGIAQIEFAGDVAVDLRWLDVNPQFERVTGLSREDVLGGAQHARARARARARVARDLRAGRADRTRRSASSGGPTSSAAGSTSMRFASETPRRARSSC